MLELAWNKANHKKMTDNHSTNVVEQNGKLIALLLPSYLINTKEAVQMPRRMLGVFIPRVSSTQRQG
jgi:deoxycytidine triphosphate deaminase